MAITAHYIKSTTFEDFDPNEMQKSEEVYGLYDGVRFRTYTSRGPVLNAVLSSYSAKLYKLTNGRWQLMATKDTNYHSGKPCDRCGAAVQSQPYTRHWFWKRKRGKIVPDDQLELLYLCGPCQPFNT